MKKALIAMMFLSSAAANAQLLEIVAPDTTGLSNGIIANHGDFENILFTDGKYTFDRPSIPRYQEVFALVGGQQFSFVLEKGETLRVKLTKKDGRFTADYSGKNRDATVFVNEAMELNASGWQKFSADENGDEVVSDVKDFDFDAELKRINALYPRIIRLAKKVKDQQLREKYIHWADVTLLSSRIALIDAQEKRNGRNAARNHSEEMEQLLAQINPNDTVMMEIGLVDRLLSSKRSHDFHDKDLTAYASEYIGLIDQYVKEPKIRRKFLNDIALSVFNAELGEKVFDLDAFWARYRQSAPKDLIAYYQKVVDSKKATAAGVKCPDATFMDIDGNSHSLSEFFGKGQYLYIDLWATWCGPCCAEIPYIEKHVAHYKGNDKIKFISISIDNDKEAWKRKLAKDKPQWAQFVTRNKEEYSKLSNDWGITGIPRFIIVSPDGTIYDNAAFRPSHPDFVKLIDEMLGK